MALNAVVDKGDNMITKKVLLDYISSLDEQIVNLEEEQAKMKVLIRGLESKIRKISGAKKVDVKVKKTKK